MLRNQLEVFKVVGVEEAKLRVTFYFFIIHGVEELNYQLILVNSSRYPYFEVAAPRQRAAAL